MQFNDLIPALRKADPKLSRYNPLPRILFFDDFDNGLNGWCELVGNHDGDLDKIRPHFADLRPPQLSSCTFFDVGTHGSVDGNYAMKVATRARANHMSMVIKRMTFVRPGLVQFETYFTYKAEQQQPQGIAWDGNAHPSELMFGDFAFSNDVCEGENFPRFHCALRYANTDPSGNLVQKWMYKTSVQPTTKIALAQPKPMLDLHVQDPNDWLPVPDGSQKFCYNETASKVNWHYLRWVFDTAERRNLELQVNDRTFDLTGVPVPKYPHPYRALDHLLNFCIDVRTHRPVRNFLFLDSVLVSVDW